MDLSNFLTLTVDTIWSHYKDILNWQIEFVLVWSTSNCHHCSGLVWNCCFGWIWTQSQCLLLFCNEHCFYKIYSNIPVAEVSCVCSDNVWHPLATVTVDSNHPTCLWNGNYQILPGIPIFGIDSPLPNAGDLQNLWSFVFCKGVQMTTVAGNRMGWNSSGN